MFQEVQYNYSWYGTPSRTVDQDGRVGTKVRASCVPTGSPGLLLDPPSSSMNGGLVVLSLGDLRSLCGNPKALYPLGDQRSLCGQAMLAEDTARVETNIRKRYHIHITYVSLSQIVKMHYQHGAYYPYFQETQYLYRSFC